MKFLRINKLLRKFGLCLTLIYSCDNEDYEPRVILEKYSTYLTRCEEIGNNL